MKLQRSYVQNAQKSFTLLNQQKNIFSETLRTSPGYCMERPRQRQRIFKLNLESTLSSNTEADKIKFENLNFCNTLESFARLLAAPAKTWNKF